MERHRISPEITVLSDHMQVPGIGFLAVNTFVLHAEQPVVVDTGLGTPDKDYVSSLAAVIDPAEVRWIWLTHPDRDHTGGLWRLLDAAPHARLITTFGGMGILACEFEVPMHRVQLLNPGERLDIGDRSLTAYRPPLFDSPVTVGFQESRGGAFFASDCFGGDSHRRAGQRARPARGLRRGPPRGAAAVGAGRQPVGEAGGSGGVPTGRRRAPRARSLGDPQHPPATGNRYERPAVRHTVGGAGRPGVLLPGPGRARVTPRQLRTCLARYRTVHARGLAVVCRGRRAGLRGRR